MHIPDGFIDLKTALTTLGFSAVGVSFALRQARRELRPRQAPLLGLAAAFLFTAQLLNFPVAGGTSGHLIGGVLVAALLGPSAAVVVVTTVLIVQCFLFQDGGVLALGANIFNMALIGAVGGYFIYRTVRYLLPGMRGQVTALAFAGWCSTVLASMACAGQLAWSGMVNWSAAFTAMTGVHMLIGIGEGLISALVFLAIQRTRPEMITESSRTRSSRRMGELLSYGLLVTLGLAVFVAPFACPWPDGLEAVATKLGFARQAAQPALAPMPGYQLPAIHWAAGATALAGLIGSFVVFVLALLLGWWIVPRPAASVTEGEKAS